jgi:hypothetical protein
MSDGSIKIWQQIVDSSTLELWLESVDGGFLGTAACIADSGAEEDWPHDQLVPGPKRKKLASPRMYATRIRVAFTAPAQTTVTIRARVVKPNGSVHADPYAYTVKGKKGTIRRATIICNTKAQS